MAKQKRAISENEKNVKAEMIIDAAADLWNETDFEGFTMQALAQKMNLAKGTLYLYFKTKEEVFLSLYHRLLSSWFIEIENSFTKNNDWTSEKIARTLSLSLSNISPLIRLIAILGTVLEKNISYEKAVEFKTWLVHVFNKTASLIEQSLPTLRKGDGHTILVFLQATGTGLYSMSYGSPVIQEVLKKKEFQSLHIDFSKTLRQGMEVFINGLANTGKPQKEE